jgi:hypothetical protein
VPENSRSDKGASELFTPPQIPSKFKFVFRIKSKIKTFVTYQTVSSLNFRKLRPIIIREGDNLRLQCASTGNPTPTIVWEREDGKVIDWGIWKDNSKVGFSINITKINRVHMGTYVCIADNAIPPAARHKFHVEVHCKFSLI